MYLITRFAVVGAHHTNGVNDALPLAKGVEQIMAPILDLLLIPSCRCRREPSFTLDDQRHHLSRALIAHIFFLVGDRWLCVAHRLLPAPHRERARQ